MIFVTVGTQLNFDRLIKIVENWCMQNRYEDVIFQVGPSDYKTKIGESFCYLAQREYQKYYSNSEVVISHAGMGTILSCLTDDKPLIIMPRSASLGEHRNEHQLATYNQFVDFESIFGFKNSEDFIANIDNALKYKSGAKAPINKYASDELLNFLSNEMKSS